MELESSLLCSQEPTTLNPHPTESSYVLQIRWLIFTAKRIICPFNYLIISMLSSKLNYHNFLSKKKQGYCYECYVSKAKISRHFKFEIEKVTDFYSVERWKAECRSF
jgi:hypothetical protein